MIEEFFTDDLLLSLLPVAGFFIVFFMTLFCKKSSKKRGRANKESPYDNMESLSTEGEE